MNVTANRQSPILAKTISFLDSRVSLYLVFACAILLMTILAWYDAKYGIISGLSVDTLRFHLTATKIANGEIASEFRMGASFYDHSLGMFYKLTAPDEIFGNMLSVFASAMALFYLVKCLDALSVVRFQSVILLLIAFDPTFLLHGSVTLRESFQLLCLVSGIYLIIRLFRADTKLELLVFTVLLGASMFILACLHIRVLMPISVFILFAVGAIYLFADRRVVRKLIVIGTVTLFVLAIAFAGYEYKIEFTPGVPDHSQTTAPEQNQTTGDKSNPEINSLFRSLEQYRTRISNLNPRTLYPVSLEFSSIERFVKSGIVVYGQYLFYPFVFGIDDARDMVPALGSLIRLALIVYILTGYRRFEFGKPNMVYCWSLLGLYIIVSGLWALGSISYGQALRHHMLSNWLLVLSAGFLFNATKPTDGLVADS